MDSTRFGRALGFGARSAAKAFAGAVDAATAPNPRKPASPSRPAAATPSPAGVRNVAPIAPLASAARTAARATIQTAARTDAARKGIVRGSKRFGEAVWGPFVKLSGVLWLEITGSFFGIFALFAGHAVWNHRSELRSGLDANPVNRAAHFHLLLFIVMTFVFGYFCISSFVRAYRK